MRGITVTAPGCELLAVEAAYRWERHTGLPASIYIAATRREASDVKLGLRGACWFFDADLWLVRDWAPPSLRGDCIFATPVVPGPKGLAHIREWAGRAQVDPHCWISGGIYGADWDAPLPNHALQLAREYLDSEQIRGRDEEPLNVGLQRAGAVPAMLPSTCNWHPHCGEKGYGYAPPSGPIAIHAGGIPAAEKLTFLQQHATHR